MDATWDADEQPERPTMPSMAEILLDAAEMERLIAIKGAFLAGDLRYSEDTAEGTRQQRRLEFGRYLAERVSGDAVATHAWSWSPGTGLADLLIWDDWDKGVA